jgi:hypothetical protein
MSVWDLRRYGDVVEYDQLVSNPRQRPTYPGFLGENLPLVNFNPDYEAVEAIQRPVAVAAPDLELAPEVADELRCGLGRVDMDIRWLVWLDDQDVLHLWRSWTGFEIYRASFVREGPAYELRMLEVESDPERYRANLADEPAQFLEVYRAQLELLGLRG